MRRSIGEKKKKTQNKKTPIFSPSSRSTAFLSTGYYYLYGEEDNIYVLWVFFSLSRTHQLPRPFSAGKTATARALATCSPGRSSHLRLVTLFKPVLSSTNTLNE